MNLKPRLPLLLAVLLAETAGATIALAETPLTDPVAPAVIGRPLDQIRPAPPARSAAAKREAVRPAPASKVVRQPAPAAAAAGVQKAAKAPAAVLGAGPMLAAPASRGDEQPTQERKAKQALDDRADTRMRTDDVGKGTHFARKPLGPGAYFDDKDRAAVRKYYQAHPLAAQAANWQIGQPVPRGAAVAALPGDLRANLPRLPPGHRYLRVGGEVVLVAAGSQMVVDGISRAPR